MLNRNWRFLLTIILFVFCFPPKELSAQGLLSKRISVQAQHLHLEDVLAKIGQKCGFRFSYNSAIVPLDSIVSLSVTDETVRDVLDHLFGDQFEYKETAGYVILRYAPLRLSLIADKVQNINGLYFISGVVIDDRTGKKISKASVYEKKLLRSALTDNDGTFDIKINTQNNTIALTVSKENYRDTTVLILSSVNVNSDGSIHENDEYWSESGSVSDKTFLGRLLVSSKQKIQDLNVPGFITQSPVQASIVPGLSSHGMLSGQVINNFSYNLLGGYTAGVEGVETGGLFNINKRYVKGVQVAGLFNIVGESVAGVQVAGLGNGVLGAVRGIEVGGVLNIALGSVMGVQVGGIANFSSKNVGGLQIAGIVNIAGKEMKGAQVSLLNIARKQKGLQFGLVNIADTASGISLGLINIIRKNGIHSLSGSSNEINSKNLVVRTGTNQLYTIIQFGKNLNGLGLGKAYQVTNHLSINPEILNLYVYQGSTDYTNSLNRFNLNLSFKLNKYISAFAGPSFNLFYSDQDKEFDGYKLIPHKIKTFKISSNDRVRGWVGWSAGISIF
ncbi:LA_2272 family surface repeat-containing protein [Arcticibacter eurypsychrophilus]|uniref:LA_2272 family surface repeat-containing protein n=1 Tax=Arcticibacter eurypsychrophilus TaxID=1434752 RepID=UPI00084D2E38|nr:carboxypeptidase-like regulatory domain-containing protein [Arcticibacter eurypsychrophilus]